MERVWSKAGLIFLIVLVIFSPSQTRAESDTAGHDNEQYEKSLQTSSLAPEEKQYLLKLARSAITHYLKEKELLTVSPEKLSLPLTEKKGCFVTLMKNGRLRGCIGCLQPRKRLYESVIDNAINAAVHDTRFPAPVSFEELDSITIEISVLTVPKKMVLKNREELPNHLEAGRDGVILRCGWHQATYLPQVWEHFPEKALFLDSLCRKGGMPAGCWQDPDTEIYTYHAEVFHEEKH